MAVRSAYSLGLHRDETYVIFSPEEQQDRLNLWRSLYILDRFLSMSLGRHTAISEDDCAGHILNVDGKLAFAAPPSLNQINPLGVEASIRSCHIIGKILKRVYQRRRISTKLAQEIAEECKIWPQKLSSMLHWRQIPLEHPSQG